MYNVILGPTGHIFSFGVDCTAACVAFIKGNIGHMPRGGGDQPNHCPPRNELLPLFIKITKFLHKNHHFTHYPEKSQVLKCIKNKSKHNFIFF